MSGRKVTQINDISFSASKAKLLGACDRAQKASIEYIWADTVCIDKLNSAELTRALNSMFEYYHKAAVCYTFLFDVVQSTDALHSTLRNGSGQASAWFSRGWTLQELLAPQQTQFYDQNWRFLGTRGQLARQVSEITGIDTDYLGEPPTRRLKEASVAVRMSWMAGGVTGEIEDIAYSLIGVLGVFMTSQYGEGKHAFTRLQQTLLNSPSFDESLFAWTSNCKLACFKQTQYWSPQGDHWGLLAPSPDCFRSSEPSRIFRHDLSPRYGAGFVWSYRGVSFDLPWRLGRNIFGTEKKAIELPLNCARNYKQGKALPLTVQLAKTPADLWVRVNCSELDEVKKGGRVIDNKSFGVEQGPATCSRLNVQQPPPP